MNLIKISTDLELSVHEFPTGTHEEHESKCKCGKQTENSHCRHKN